MTNLSDITTFDDYVEATRETAPDQPPEAHLQQGALGFAGEYREYQRAISCDEARREAGDCFWYLARVIDGLRALTDSELSDLTPIGAQSIRVAYDEMCEAIEDGLYQHKEGALDEAFEHAGRLLLSLHHDCPGEAVEVWRANLSKLSDRYPDGYEPGGGER